jgi:hypothetical protein
MAAWEVARKGYGAGMARKDDLLRQLREMAGTPQEMATAVGVEASDRSFRRAIGELVDEGTLIAMGTTRDRSYANANSTPAPAQAASGTDAALLALVPCTAQEFSAQGRKLIADSQELGRAKLRLGIETFKGGDGRWYCRHVEGYAGPERSAREEAGLEGDDFAHMAARAGKSGLPIGGRPKAVKGAE